MFGSNFTGGYPNNFAYGMNPPSPSMQNFNNSGYQGYVNNAPKINIGFVASIDEARAYQTPMDGSTLYLVNSSKGEVYSKALAPNGAVDFHTYTEVKVNPEDSALEQLKKRVEALEQQIKQSASATGVKKGKGTDE